MNENITVKNISIDLDYWLDFQSIPQEERNRVKTAKVVLLPANYPDAPHAFASDTEVFLAYCRKHLGNDINICVTEDDFTQLEMNSAVLRIGVVLVKYVVLPLFLNVLANFVYDKIKNKPKENETEMECLAPPTVSFKLIVDDENGKTKEFSYEGPADDVKKVTDEIKNMWE